MMMPANFSAVAENEMTYVVGGSIAEYLAPAMEAKQWSNFHKNLITIVGNTYLADFIGNTVGTVFSGSYVPGTGVRDGFWKGIWTAYDSGVAAIGDDSVAAKAVGVLNAALNVAGNAAAVYNLGFGTTKNYASEKIFTVDGNTL